MTEVNCPTCSGIGQIKNITRIEGLQIVAINGKVNFVDYGCGMGSRYKVLVNISVINRNPNPVSGVLEVLLVDPATGKEVEGGQMHFNVAIPGDTTAVISRVWYFRRWGVLDGGESETFQCSLGASPSSDFPCPTCDGEGKIPLAQLYLLGEKSL